MPFCFFLLFLKLRLSDHWEVIWNRRKETVCRANFCSIGVCRSLCFKPYLYADAHCWAEITIHCRKHFKTFRFCLKKNQTYSNQPGLINRHEVIECNMGRLTPRGMYRGNKNKFLAIKSLGFHWLFYLKWTKHAIMFLKWTKWWDQEIITNPKKHCTNS